MEQQIGRTFKYVAIIKYKCYIFCIEEIKLYKFYHLLANKYVWGEKCDSVGQKHSRICKVEIDINTKLDFLL